MAFTASIRRRMISTIDRADSKPHLDPSAQEWMQSISSSEYLAQELSEIIPKLYAAQQRHHQYANELAEILKDTYISPADLNDTFSNPEDPFAAFCKLMGFELSKFELIEKDYLQKVNHDLITPLRQFHSNEFKEVYNLHSRYKRVLSKMYKPSKSPRNVQTPRGSMFDLSVLDDQSEEYINKRMVMCILCVSESITPYKCTYSHSTLRFKLWIHSKSQTLHAPP